MFYWVAHWLMRGIGFATLRVRHRGIGRGARAGGYVLACSHVSHLDPFCLGAMWPRRIGWMARIEFYRRAWSAWMLSAVHAFPVNRQGVPVRAIKAGLSRLARGEVVGVFPEGEIKSGAESVLRGGPIKRGVCLLAARTGCPVLPCIVLGTEKLNTVAPWLPFRRGRLWIFCGDFIEPVIAADRRAARAEMAARIEREFTRLYAEMRREFGLDDSALP